MTVAKHHRAKYCLRKKLFTGLSSFNELEQRISNLPEGERGDAFEVFAEAYLATQKGMTLAANVWPDKAVPVSLRESLALSPKDMGVDGLVKTNSGEYHSYQVKFRSKRKGLSWKDDLATFFGLSDRVDRRLIFANCNGLPDVVNERKDFYSILGYDLDRLDKSQFEEIHSWLKAGYKPRRKKKPRRHQRKALDDILTALKKHNRVTGIMACGTGKTLLSLWIAEQVKRGHVLILVPSLALLRQTLHEWMKETNWEPLPMVLNVCSDPTVTKGVDEVVVHQSDADFPVTTDSATVRQFLDKKSRLKVIFSTYQSAHIVADGMNKDECFNLAIFDEAHKTAGREGTQFSYGLTDENFPIKKRVFLTATPRHYDVRKKDKEGESKLVFSMDVPETYGPVVHKLSFAEAAKQKIIADYKVIISVTTTEMLNDELLRRGEVVVKKDVVKARQVANQIALKKAIAKTKTCKVITFHRSVDSAKSFTSSEGEGIGTHLKDFKTYHVNGTIKTAIRDGLMKEFKEAKRSVVSNARCLTEGVDVPAVDMVAFMSPKKSKVDIVQATGRAMRTAPGKATGYVLVPLFVEQKKGESLEEAVQRTDYDEVWNVLQAMQEHDDVLADIISEMRQEMGRTGGFDDSRFREKIQVIGPKLELDLLRKSISTVIVEKLAPPWDFWYGLTIRYKKEYGDANTPLRYETPEGFRLGIWQDNQRQLYKKGTLDAERGRRLEEIGLVWDPLDEAWEKGYQETVRYKEQYGDANAPARYKTPEGFRLGQWQTTQRVLYNKDKLDTERAHRLEETVRYKKQYGDANAPARYKTPEGFPLGAWQNRQRVFYNKEILDPERVRRLEETGFLWSQLDAAFEEGHKETVRYKKQYGDANVPYDYRTPEGFRLGFWLSRQRKLYKKGKLDTERARRLEMVGFKWKLAQGRRTK